MKSTQKEYETRSEGGPFEATGVAAGGWGIVRTERGVCFVRGALPGDKLTLAKMTQRRGVLWAEIGVLEAPSPARIEPVCPHFGHCGGCDWLHFAYPGQAEWKRRLLEETLRRVGGIKCGAEWRENPDLRRGYRTRATFHGGPAGWGFYREGSRRVVSISSCPLCHPSLDAALERLAATPGHGSVQLTCHPETGQILAWSRQLSAGLRVAFPQLQGPQSPPRERDGFEYDGRTILNGAFCQSSLGLNRLLVRAVEELAGGPGPLLDLYCGNGNLSAGFAAQGREVLGLDHSAAALEAAKRLGAGRYQEGGERDFAAALGEGRWECVLLDPPRTGAKVLVPALAASQTERIVYVGCDPAAFARDVGALVRTGWVLRRVIGLDLFPQTHHIEAVALLEAS